MQTRPRLSSGEESQSDLGLASDRGSAPSTSTQSHRQRSTGNQSPKKVAGSLHHEQSPIHVSTRHWEDECLPHAPGHIHTRRGTVDHNFAALPVGEGGHITLARESEGLELVCEKVVEGVHLRCAAVVGE